LLEGVNLEGNQCVNKYFGENATIYQNISETCSFVEFETIDEAVHEISTQKVKKFFANKKTSKQNSKPFSKKMTQNLNLKSKL
jgi:hypothetical protein